MCPEPGTSEQSFEAFASKLARGEFGKLPGVREYFAKAERGDDLGTYIYVVEFDSKITRDFYYPKEGSDGSDASPEVRKLMENASQGGPEFSKFADVAGSGKPNAKNYTDFVVLQ